MELAYANGLAPHRVRHVGDPRTLVQHLDPQHEVVVDARSPPQLVALDHEAAVVVQKVQRQDDVTGRQDVLLRRADHEHEQQNDVLREAHQLALHNVLKVLLGRLLQLVHTRHGRRATDGRRFADAVVIRNVDERRWLDNDLVVLGSRNRCSCRNATESRRSRWSRELVGALDHGRELVLAISVREQKVRRAGQRRAGDD